MLSRVVNISLVFCAAVLLSATSLYGQSRGSRVVDVKIYFPYDEAYIDSMYMGNQATLRLVDSLLGDEDYVSTLRTIAVAAQSSPEGSVACNTRLSERRRLSLKSYFTAKYPHIGSSVWSFTAVAENWDEFRNTLVSDHALPDREQILSVVDGGRALDSKEWALRNMNGGRTWRYIKEHILPSLRFGASILFIPWEYSPIAESRQIAADFTVEPLDDMVQYKPAPLKPHKMIFALKSNLVLDAMSVINIGAELPIGERWSVVAEVVHPWWRSWPADFTMQIESYHGEVKYWLGDRSTREQLQGWSVGAYGGWGRYDIQPFTRTGVQGYFKDFGLELGYAQPIARNLNLEYTVGLGYVSTQYSDYKMVNNTDEYGDIKVIPYPWMRNSVKSILPTRCGVSLVWTIKNRGER